MGRMKEVCMQIIEANDGIPPGMTIGDVKRMQDWKMYQWQEYEREQAKAREKHLESEDTREDEKIKEVQKKFTSYGNAHTKKRGE